MPLIGGDGVDPLWLTSPNSFPVVTSVLSQTILGLKTLIARGGSKIGILYCVELSQLCSYLNDGVKADPTVGPHVAASFQVSLVAPSYTSQCLRLKQAGVDVLWFAMDGNSAARAAKDCATQGYRPTVMLLGINAIKETPAQADLEGAYIPGSVVPPIVAGVPAIEKYRQVMALYGPTIGLAGFGVQAWAAGELLGLVGKNLPDVPTSSDFYTALWKVNNETLGGLTTAFTFLKGKAPEVKPCVFLWGTGGGKFTAPTGARPQC